MTLVTNYGTWLDGQDGTTALKAALTAAAPGGSVGDGIVMIPSTGYGSGGPYLDVYAATLTSGVPSALNASTIVVPAGVSLVGAGYGACFSPNPTQMSAFGANSFVPIIVFSSNTTCKNLTLYGNPTAYTVANNVQVTGFTCGIPGTPVTNISLDGCWSFNLNGGTYESYPFFAGYGASYVTFRDCWGTSSSPASSYCTMFQMGSTTATPPSATNFSYGRILGCKAENASGQGFSVFGGIHYEISGCSANNCGYSGINCEYALDVNVIGCVTDSCRASIGLGGSTTVRVYGGSFTNPTQAFAEWHNNPPANCGLTSNHGTLSVRGDVYADAGSQGHICGPAFIARAGGTTSQSFSIPQLIELQVENADDWIINGWNGSAPITQTTLPNTRRYVGRPTQPVPLQSLTNAAWTVGSGLTVTAGVSTTPPTRVKAANPVTLSTASGQTGTLASGYLLQPNRRYRARWMAAPADTNAQYELVVREQNSGTVLYTTLMQNGSSELLNSYAEYDLVVNTGTTNAARVEIGVAVAPSSTAAVLQLAYVSTDWIETAAEFSETVVVSVPTTMTFNVSTLYVPGVGNTATVIPTIKDQFGNAITGTVNYTSGTPGNATVGATSGIVTGVANGNSTISGSVQGYSAVTASCTATVYTQTATSIAVAPATDNLVGAGATFTATAVQLDQHAVAMVSQPSFAWSSSTPATATVGSSTGVVTAVANGTTNVSATATSITSNNCAVTVSGVNSDIATLVTNLGVTPIGIYDARYNITGTSPVTTWGDARGGSNPSLSLQTGTPVLSGSGATAEITFSSSAYMTSAPQSLPSTGISIIAILDHSSGGANDAGPQAYISALSTSILVTQDGGFYAGNVFSAGANHYAQTAVGGSATARIVAVSYLYSGTVAGQVDAQSQVTASAPTITPGSNTFVMYSSALAGTWDIQALMFLPGAFTSGQLATVASWAGSNHTFTAA